MAETKKPAAKSAAVKKAPAASKTAPAKKAAAPKAEAPKAPAAKKVSKGNKKRSESTRLLDKYENEVVSGGKIFVDSALIERKVERTDVDVYYIPSTKIANEKGIPTLANMIITGKMIKEVPELSIDNMDTVLSKIVSARHQDLLEVNKDAVRTGYDYE